MSQAPGWYRALLVILGLVAIMFAVAVWLYYTVAIFTMILLFAFSLTSIGLVGVSVGLENKGLTSGWRILWLTLGIISLAIAVIVIAFPLIGISILIILLGVGLLFNGFSGIIQGALDSELDTGYRALLLPFGILIVIASFFILLNPTLGTILWYWPPLLLLLSGTYIPPIGFYTIIPSAGYLLLVFFLSLGFIIRGIQAILSGIRER
ncbi:MAG: DUF308 domain-containing protein [Candidatus Freyarchaeota archaeon]